VDMGMRDVHNNIGSVGRAADLCYPLITPRGGSRATLRASPARCTTSTTPLAQLGVRSSILHYRQDFSARTYS
jgi:hypothetical protein